MRLLRLAVVLAAASLAVAAPAYADTDPAATDTTCAGADLQPAAGNLDQAGQATFCLLNLERSVRSLPALSLQSQLSQASTAYSGRMVAEQFFDHVSPDGGTLVDRLTAVGYLGSVDTWAAGENIAWGTGDLATPRSIVQAWMNSPPHRENILDTTFREIGMGIAVGVPQQGAGDGATYTTDFGVRQNDDGTAVDAAPRAVAARPAVKHAAKHKVSKTRCAKTARHTRSGSRHASKRHRSAKRHSAKHSRHVAATSACVKR
jgi:uncharacterized protein YkwD